MRVPWSQREWKRVLVYGLGVSGQAAVRLLRSRGVEVLGVDRRAGDAIDLGDLASDSGFEALLGSEPETVPEAVDGVVLSPGVAPQQPMIKEARRQGLAVISEVELAFLFVRGLVIGITGTNGKSTTTLLTGALLEAAGHEVEVCGNIGVPLSATVDGRDGRIFVAELSSFQLESVELFRPRAAALLNISPDHLDRHLAADSYLAAKANLFRNQNSSDIAVLNADDSRVAAVAVQARRRFFSSSQKVEDGCYLDGDIVVEIDPERGRRPLFRRQDLQIPGLHNLENAMAAALLSRAVGADPATFPDVMAGFEGLPHRLQQVSERRGVVWYDDSKATNFAATLKSLAGFADGTVHLILGGRNKGGDPADLQTVVERKARRLYLVGEAAEEIARALGSSVDCELCRTVDTAVVSAAERARPGEVVLLSPACASFDQFRDFAQRGDRFQALVRGLDG